MPLSKSDRISFSKQIISSEATKNSIESSKEKISAEKDKAFDLDQANKNLLDSVNFFINAYQGEIDRYDGIVRTVLTESIIQESANFALGNFLFPNDVQNPPPSTAPQVWTKAKPFARSILVGKLANESFATPIPAEQNTISNALTLINKIETDYTLIQRVTGQRCVTVMMVDVISTYADLNNDYNNLLADINFIKSQALGTQAIILTSDPNTTRQSENNAAIADINTIVSAIDTWLAVTPFNTSHGQSTCSGFNSYNPALLGATRLQSGNLAAIKNALLSRQAFITSRIFQINSYLGTINQSMVTGEATGSGLYFDRWNRVLLRLNLFGGSLVQFKGFEKAVDAQQAQQDQADLSKATYESLLRTSLLSSPTNGTKAIHLKSAAGFLPGDNIFLVSETQEEIKLTIESIELNKIVVGKEVPPKYRPDELARIYKDLT
jgi:hypothetical protein